MCSVIGIYSRNGGDISRVLFEVQSALVHRGHDAFGINVCGSEKKAKELGLLAPLPIGNFGLAHCLLSTTGYGVQPLTSNGISVVHNGQIYNYLDFSKRKNLVSDSEGILDYFAGALKSENMQVAVKKFMEKAVGEYAIGISFKNKLFAFRDPIGQKPLWFGSNDSFTAFASEPSALMKADIPFPLPLKPGHLLEITSKGFKEKNIFSIPQLKKVVPKKTDFNSFKKEFEKTIELQTNGLKKAAVLFSGGVDSSLVAKAVSEKVKDTRLFVAGVKGSEDVVFAKRAAKLLSLKLESVILTKSDVESLLLRSAKRLSFFDEMQLGLAVPVLACSDAIAKAGYRVVFSGQGSDEIFAGYHSYSKAITNGFDAVNEEIWFSLSRMWSRNFYRDDIMLASNALELRLPFVSINFVKESMAIPASEKIISEKDSLRKHPIRKLALAYGIPIEIANRPKKAMQYGSGVQKIVSKLLKGN